MFSLIVVDYCSIDKTIAYICDFLLKSSDPINIHPIIIDNTPIEKSILHNKENILIEVGILVEGKKVFKFSHNDRYLIYYCHSGENCGYARGNNLGACIAKELFGDPYYIISNNDLKLVEIFNENKFLSIFRRDERIAVVGPRIIGLDGKDQSPHKSISAFSRLIAYYWLSRWPFRWKPDYDYTAESKFCYRVMGSFMILRADAFHKIGGFDAHTFMFAEEPILSERLKNKGYYTYFYNDWIVIHEHSESIKKLSSIFIAEEWAFNSCCYYYKEYRGTSLRLIKIAEINFKIYKKRIEIREKIKERIKQI